MREQLTTRSEFIADCEHEQERGEERHQTEVAHGSRGGEEIVFVKLVQRVAEHRPPRRAVPNAE